MKKSGYEWKVGLFLVIALALLGGLLLQFSKGTTFFHHPYKILLRASNIGGLKTRATVLMAGVQIGTVADINLGPQGTNVTITLSLYRQYLIHKDARFTIEQSGFLGDQFVSIVPTKNEAEVFLDNEVAQADGAFNIQEVARSAQGFLVRVDETVGKLNDTIADVRKYVLNQETLTNLSVSVGNLRAVTERAVITVDKLNEVLGTNATSLAASSSNLVVFTRQINEFASGLKDLVSTNRPVIDNAVSNIDSATLTLKNAMEDLQAGKGLAGKLLKDEEMAQHVSEMVNNLSITTSNLNRLGVWGILWKKKAPSPPKSEAREPIRNSKDPSR
jgi:phospholipid/cholesterol/gamma-HCH transport system substrate-binding protein